MNEAQTTMVFKFHTERYAIKAFRANRNANLARKRRRKLYWSRRVAELVAFHASIDWSQSAYRSNASKHTYRITQP